MEIDFRIPFVLIAGGIVLAISVPPVSAQNTTRYSGRRVDELVCGPRCVQYVLRRYAVEEDLIELVREIQWPHLESGATLEALADALAKRSVYSRAIRIESVAQIRWPHPVILHLSGDGKLGHYLVMLPTRDDGGVRVWPGLAEEPSPSLDDLDQACSGAVLLTSPQPMSENCPLLEADPTLYFWFVCLALLVMLGSFFFRRFCHRVLFSRASVTAEGGFGVHRCRLF
jgi:ABC-type bacteriocin/lantibiotic exporter with double-glycine peptidase domain